MPIQSYLMMYFAGAGWQIGKRKISAIPNEEFNKMSANDLLKGFTADLRETIPTLESSMNDVTPLIKTLIEQYGDFIRIAIETIPQLAQNVVGGTAGANLQSNLQGFDNILKWIKQQFPNLPESDAMLMTVKIDKINRNLASTKFEAPPLSTIKGLTVPEAQQQARDKQIAFEKVQELARQKSVPGRIVFTKSKQPIPQVRQGLTKKAAGQSQIFERLKLIRNIAVNTKLLKAGGVSTKILEVYAKRIRNDQQTLVNLLARYRF